MDPRKAKIALSQFRQWLRAADKVQEVVDNLEQMEQQAKEAEQRRAATEDALRQLRAEEVRLSREVEALRQGARETKLSIEHETQRVKERARRAREEAELAAEEAESKLRELHKRLGAV